MLIKDIRIKNRIRKDLGDLTLLKQSLEKNGLLYPIIIDSKKNLIAGERRLRAAKELGWIEIDVLIKDISPKEAIIIELDENISRKEFNASEIAKGFQRKKELNKTHLLYKIFYFFKNLFNK